MGGRGAKSASDKRFYSNQRDGFRKIAERAENGSNTQRNKDIAATARAAEKLVGTDRARDLVGDWNVRQVKTEIEQAYAIVGAGVLGDLRNMLDDSMLNNPLGSGYSHAEWQSRKDAVQGYVANLESAGYTVEEVAAALAYGRYIWR